MMKKICFRQFFAFLFVTGSVVFTGCQNEMTDQDINEAVDNCILLSSKSGELKYIDIDLVSLNLQDLVTSLLYVEALERLKQYSRYENGKFCLSVNNGGIVGISERLFAHLKSIMKRMNKEIKNLDFVQTSLNELLLFQPMNGENKSITGVVRANDYISGYDTDFSHKTTTKTVIYCGYSETMYLDNKEAIAYFSKMKDLNTYGGYGTSTLMLIFKHDFVVSFILATVRIFTYSMYAHYYDEAVRTGANYELTDIYQPLEAGENGHTYVIRRI